MPILTPGYYYAQQGADPTQEYPAMGFGGWNKADVPIEPERTAVLVMHAWKVPDYEAHMRHLEYLSRANAIIRDKFPPFLQAVRSKGIRLIHIAGGFEHVLPTLPGYQRITGKYPAAQVQEIELSKEMKHLCEKHWSLVGAQNDDYAAQFERAYAEYDLAVKPLDDEDVVVAENQLFSLCCEHGIEHLIYTGFAVNACLLSARCGMVDMSRHGLMCSVVGDLTTAVENKETCKTQENLKYGLWKFATQRGFVFLSEDLRGTLLR